MRSLDGVRGLLAVYVLLGHAMPLTMAPPWLGALCAHGQAAVDLFFCLSGFVIAGSLERHNGRFFPFMAARARRLLPVYILALGFALLAACQGDPLPRLPWRQESAWEIFAPTLPAPLWPHLLAHLTLLHGALPQSWLPYGWMTILGPAWSLSTEWQFYLVIALISPRRLESFSLALLGAAFLYQALPHGGFSRAFLPDAAGWFALGIASRAWVLAGRPGPFLLALAALCVLASLTAPAKSLTALAWAGLMLGQRQGWTKTLAARPLLYLGAISYPLYLMNEPVERLAALWLAPRMAGNALGFSLIFLPLTLLVSLALAALLHHAIERPLLRRKTAPRLPAPALSGL
ncbi:acyltransferase [Acidocella sp.]|uniref:acyltransferase family protein n=1 Tax=Acidocella sp. TaxID=50710 RepID=UPI00261851A9|nr:acyltransferase [Acidocella sp.]